MVQKDLHKISVHAKSHNTMYGIVNLEDTTDITLLGVITHNETLIDQHSILWFEGQREKERKD